MLRDNEKVNFIQKNINTKNFDMKNPLETRYLNI